MSLPWDNSRRAGGGIGAPPQLPALAAWYDASDAASLIVDGSNRVSLMSDKSGNSATNVLANGINSGGAASTPSVAANRVTGDFTIVQRLSGDTLAGAQISASKDDAATARCFSLDWSATTPRIEWSSDGIAFTTKSATAVIPYAVGVVFWIKVEFIANNGSGGYDVRFYTAADTGNNVESAVVWVQLGATVTTAGVAAIFDSATQVFAVGARQGAAGGNNWIGQVYYTSLRKNVGGAINQVFNPSVAAKLATSFVSSTGETWTVVTAGDSGARICGARDLYQGTVANQPVLSTDSLGRRIITFDGTNDYLASAVFTTATKTMNYLVMNQVAWTANKYIFDANTNFSAYLRQKPAGVSPQLNVQGVIDTTSLGVGVLGLVSFYFGVAGLLRINRNTPGAGDTSGATVQTGITIGASGGGANNSNVAISELAAYTPIGAHDVTTLDRFALYVSRKWRGVL